MFQFIFLSDVQVNAAQDPRVLDPLCWSMEPIVTNQQLEEHEGVLIRIVPVDPF